MHKEIFQKRTMDLATRIIQMVNTMPHTDVAKILGNQIVRSSSSVGANYRATCRGKSKGDFINKLKIVEEEADETLFWLDMIENSGIIKGEKLISLKSEMNEIVGMVVASLKTLRAGNRKS